jgi:protein SCO1/2
MRAFAIAALLLLVAGGPVSSAVTEKDLAKAVLAPPPNAIVPLSLPLRDLAGRALTLGDALAGRAALVIPVDFTCRGICGPALAILSASLVRTGLRPGSDFAFVVVGIDPEDSAENAHALLDSRVGDPDLAAAATILPAGPGTQDLEDLVGYRFVYDAETDQFAHPAGVLVLSADGRLSRVLPSLSLDERTLRLAIIEASQGRIGSVMDRVALLCSGFDPVRGIYTPLILRVLAFAAAVTAGALAAALLWLHRRDATRARGET